MLAETNYTGIAIIALGALLVLVSVGALLLRNRARGRGPEIPTAMRPGPSDAALETPVFSKLQGWGVLLVSFASTFGASLAFLSARFLFREAIEKRIVQAN